MRDVSAPSLDGKDISAVADADRKEEKLNEDSDAQGQLTVRHNVVFAATQILGLSGNRGRIFV